MSEVEKLFARKMARGEFETYAGRIYSRYAADPRCVGVMAVIQKRLPQLLAYTQLPAVPTTNNLIESFNSHLEGRLKTIKGFESFGHANVWLNAYFVRRRLKKFTDCQGKFKNLNGKTSIEMSLKPNQNIITLLRLIR